MNQDLIRRITQLERRLDELLKPEVSRWLGWTPTVTQSGAVTATITYARYVVIANAVVTQARLVITGTGTAGNAVEIGGIPSVIQPARFGSATHTAGIGLVSDSGVGFYVGALIANTVSTFRIAAHNETNVVGIDPNFALASGDIISFQAAYERA